MRIIAGEWRGRTIAAPAGRSTRPTADRVRETVFNMLASRLGTFDELRVADLFAGSGALGFEALSRGAGHVTFVEDHAEALAAIRANAAKLRAQEKIAILACSAVALPPSAPFDLIFADPPYGPGSGNSVVQAVTRAQWLAAGGWMSVETSRGESVEAAGMIVDTARDVGSAQLTLLRRP
jgi:16S rRNA (guanine966-N2)-methyltransferase